MHGLNDRTIAQNLIAQIPKGGAKRRYTYDKQGNLRRLDLSKLGLTSLPLEVSQFVHLHKLDLSQNKLGKLPAELGQLSQLQEFDLWNNHLSDLPGELGQL